MLFLLGNSDWPCAHLSPPDAPSPHLTHAQGDFLHNMLSQQRSIVNAMAINHDGVMVTGGRCC